MCVCAESAETRKSCQASRGWRHLWVLGTEVEPSVREVSALNPWASPTWGFFFLIQGENQILKKCSKSHQWFQTVLHPYFRKSISKSSV